MLEGTALAAAEVEGPAAELSAPRVPGGVDDSHCHGYAAIMAVCSWKNSQKEEIRAEMRG